MEIKKVIVLVLVYIWSVSGCFAGNYIEFKFSGNQMVKGIMKVWYQDGNTRTEINLGEMGLPLGGNMVGLNLKQHPKKTFMLNMDSKTYSEITQPGQKGGSSHKSSDYLINHIGKEKVNGFNANHITIKKKGESQEMHYWISKEVKGFEDLRKIKGEYLADEDLYQALSSKGFDGFPVKMKMKISENEIVMDLIKSESLQIPDSKFSLDGFQKKELPFGPNGMDLEKIKSMSPEERQKLMEEMMKQYGK